MTGCGRGKLNADIANQVLSWAALEAIWGKPLGTVSTRHNVHMGVDLAEIHDQNAICIRRGPEILYLDRVRSDPRALAREVVGPLCHQYDVKRLYYDAGGGGNGPEFGRECQLIGLSRDVYIIPEHFGGAVKGKDEDYMRGITNGNYFSLRNAQLAWGLRQRLAYSTMHLSGTQQNLDKCLWFTPGLKAQKGLLFQHLTQPVMEDTTSEKKKLVKDPFEAGSPDYFDSLCLAYAHDSESGLRYYR